MWYIPHLITKLDIQKEFNQIPIYSENGECDYDEYIDPLINIMGTKPHRQCKYSLSFTVNETMEKYDDYLVSNGWTCFSEKSTYFKGKYRLSISFEQSYYDDNYYAGWLALYNDGGERQKEMKERSGELFNCYD